MNNKERKMFWNKLCSLKGENDSLEDTIKYPKYLYRYRSLTISNLEEIIKSKLTFSTSNYYDDPFDTNLKINRKKS